jgi:hypothetical protein
MNAQTHDAYLAIIDAAEARAEAAEKRIVELTIVGDALYTQAQHGPTCALQHGSWCTCALGEWMRLGEGV